MQKLHLLLLKHVTCTFKRKYLSIALLRFPILRVLDRGARVAGSRPAVWTVVRVGVGGSVFRCSLSVVQLHRTTHRCWIEWTSPVPAQTAKRYVKVGHPAAYFIVVLVVAAVSLCLLLNLVLCLLFFLHDCIRFLVIALFCDLYRMINVV